MKDLINRLARACAHGIRQKELVNELLVGPVKVERFLVPGGAFPGYSHRYGEAQVGAKSFQNMRRRLAANGFFFVRSKDGTTIEMKFSE